MPADVFVLLALVTAFLVLWFGALALARAAVGNSTSRFSKRGPFALPW